MTNVTNTLDFQELNNSEIDRINGGWNWYACAGWTACGGVIGGLGGPAGVVGGAAVGFLGYCAFGQK